MKNPKIYSRLMSKTKFQASNKTNDIFNQINILNKRKRGKNFNKRHGKIYVFEQKNFFAERKIKRKFNAQKNF